MAHGPGIRPTRRSLAFGAGALYAWAHAPRFAQATTARDPRLLVVILRGALDGLSAVAPIGDPSYRDLRESIALQAGGPQPALPLDGFFYLHPAMRETARLFRERKLSVVHAVATPYRDRSHFDGQDVLESGTPRPGTSRTGWLNRLAAHLPAGRPLGRGEGQKDGQGADGLAVGASTPLILRGPAPVLAWYPSDLPPATATLFDRMAQIYAHTDPKLAEALDRAIETDRMAAEAGIGANLNTRTQPHVQAARSIATGAARFLVRPDGPRVAALSFDGFDTHAHTGGASGRLADLLQALDAALQAFEVELAPVWRDTAIVVTTEFGRAARLNGTLGTDHGNGTIALLAGGAIAGGRMITDWPGLRENQLYEKRDLMPTLDLRAVLKGVAMDLLGASDAVLSRDVFPGTEHLPPVRGLIV